ncbi:DegT/DnrJ/EryC1/StrS family aminotransferase [Flavihumibacter sp. RY-1]|uniref:DegT/DnrJ/EryC1/StrS family aminotransferase n=1 Tax=Flavihumibacter fluminis TaxID=2909236 RepID=A0ABS9BMU8_9BACT|nr:DegT/DnrJ/EryC1/StrS family aminotransferase [Flavihumibacter fluminis]MCF1716392.1 DegT/DnrJ/EryC1/StrS family aminotransferase [Flavihumibacter fluminis]
MKIPFLDFTYMHSGLREEMIDAFAEVYDSNWFILGKKVDAFESEFARFCGSRFCAGVSNGLDALKLALMALGIKEGDEVIVPSNTYIATPLAVSFVGAKPVFVEPSLKTYNIDPDLISDIITERTKAIIPVHLYGQACEMEQIMDIAHKYKLFIIEDNAQAQGAMFNECLTGNWGDINATSFYPGKNLGALGDAGAITTNNSEHYEKILALRNYGSKAKYVHDFIGYNMRLDEIQASFLSVKLKKLNDWNKQRSEIAQRYNEMLDGVGDVVLPKLANKATHVYHLYVIRTKYRNKLQKYLSDQGVCTLIHYPIPPHLQNAYSHLNYSKGAFPIAEELADTSLSLPIWPGLNLKQIETISMHIKAFFSAQ